MGDVLGQEGLHSPKQKDMGSFGGWREKGAGCCRVEPRLRARGERPEWVELICIK